MASRAQKHKAVPDHILEAQPPPGMKDHAEAVEHAARDHAGERERWPLAGDQLYLDLDLSDDNLPHGSRLAIGSAVIEVTAIPHNGCLKFKARFGKEAVQFVNSDVGKRLHLRGINAKIIQPGVIRQGDVITKL